VLIVSSYSGVSWIISGVDDARIHTVDNWPNGLEHVKVPTAISYRTNGTIEWGYAISPDAERLSWFKLLLAEEILPPDVRDSIQLKVTKKVLHRLKKSAEEVTADYLRRLWEYALTDIRRQNPRSIDGMPFRIVIGVPANWPQDAQNKMRDAAKQAGLLDPRAGGLMTALEFVAEPEAAALAAFHEGNVRHDIQVSQMIAGRVAV
jgi:molecular chaperone DnaK (HSP70)